MDTNENQSLPASIDNDTDRGLRQLKTMLAVFFSWRFSVHLALFFTAVALPLAFYLRTYDSAMIKITIMQLGCITALTIWLLGSISEGRIEIPSKIIPFILPALLLLLWNAVRFAFSQYRIAALNGFITQEIFLVTFMLTLLSFSGRDLRRAVIIILSGWLVTILYGFIQFFGVDPFAWKGAFGGQAFSTMGNPVFFAAYLLLCAPLASALASDDENPLWLRITAAIFSILGAFLIVRTGVVIEKVLFIAASAAFMLLAWKFLKLKNRRIVIWLNSICIIVCLLASTNLTGFKKTNTDFLLETWKGTVSLIKTQPWLGSGPGSFVVRYPSFRRSQIILIEHKHNTETDHPESELLEQWSDAGIPGVFFWLWMFGMLLYGGWKRLSDYRSDRISVYGAGIYIALTACLFAMLMTVSQRFACPGWLIYFTAGLLGVFCAHQPHKPDTVLALPLPFGRLRLVFVLLISAGAAFAVWNSALIFKSDTHHNFAVFFSKQGEYKNALEEYAKEVHGSPAYVMGQYFMGNVYQDCNKPEDLEKAVKQYRKVRNMAPDYVNVHFQEASALQKLNRIPEAIERMERQVQIDPVWEGAWRKLAELYNLAGNVEKTKIAEQKAEEAKALWENSTTPITTPKKLKE